MLPSLCSALVYIIQTSTADQAAETDMHSEYARQREHMERSVATLRKKMAKDTEIHRADNIRIMQVRYVFLLINCGEVFATPTGDGPV